jgi:hypothetical protein
MKIEPTDGGKKPGIITRIFGTKKPSGPSMPPMSTTPTVKPPAPPPPVLPLPAGGLSRLAPPPQSGVGLSLLPSVTAEPAHLVTDIKPVTSTPVAIPQAPTQPAPAPAPVVTPVPTPPMPLTPQAPMVPEPAPISLPALPSPTPPVPVPAPVPTPQPAPLPIPTLPAAPETGLPPIPVPGGTSSIPPVQVVVPVSYGPQKVEFDREVLPWVISLQTMTAPAARMTAARALAECRDCQTDAVKGMLFQAALLDPSGEVRATCIKHLSELGYTNPYFLCHIQLACYDSHPTVRAVAVQACAKMLRRQ